MAFATRAAARANVVTLSGAPLRVNPEPPPPEAPADAPRFAHEVMRHISETLGPVARVWCERISYTVQLFVHHVEPTASRPFHTFVTSGMSDRPMRAPDAAHAHRYAELAVSLPAEWPVDEAGLARPSCYWPIGVMKHIARFPHRHDTWLDHAHAVPNGDPPAPYDDSTAFTGVMLSEPRALPQAFGEACVEGESISFFSLIPLLSDEQAIHLREGPERLLARLDAAGVDECIEPGRQSVSPRRWNPWASQAGRSR